MKDDIKLIGREQETQFLREACRSLSAGKGKLILISGESGVGKTALVETVLAGSGLKIFTARTPESARPPYYPFINLLRDYLRLKGDAVRGFGPLTPYLSLLLPELAPGQQLVQKEADRNKELLMEAIIAALQKISKKEPFVLFIDDLQWTDEASLELLLFLADKLKEIQCLVLATYRSDDIMRDHPLRRMRNELRRRRRLEEIEIGPLDKKSSNILIRHIFSGSETFPGQLPGLSLLELIYSRSQGIPLFIEELAAALLTQRLIRKGENGLELVPGENIPVPESIRDAVLIRLGELTGDAREKCEIAAVAGMEFDPAMIVKIAGNDHGVDELFQCKVIVENESGTAAFGHSLVRDAVLSEIGWSRRRNLNRLIADMLEQTGAPPEQVAGHLLAADEPDRARHALIASAESFCSIHAYRDAARVANQALEIWPQGREEEQRIHALWRFSHCAQVSGQLSEAVKALHELTNSDLIQKDHHRRGEAYRALATVYGLQGAGGQSLAAREQAALAFEQAGDNADAAIEWLIAAGRNSALLRLATSLEILERAFLLAGKADRLDIQARILGLKGNVLAMQGKDKEGIETAHRGLTLALDNNLNEAAAEVYRRLGSTLEYASKFKESEKAYHTAYNFCQNNDIETQARLCLSCMSYVLFRTGEWKQSLQFCREVINSEHSPPGSLAAAHGVMGLIRIYRGETRAARRHLQETIQYARSSETPAMELVAYWAFAMMHEFDGNDGTAADHYLQFLEFGKNISDVHDSLPGMGAAVSFFAGQGREQETAQCVDMLTTIATATGNSEALGMLAFALGETALLRDEPDVAARQFVRAMENFEKLEIPLEIMLAQFRTGVAYSKIPDQQQAEYYLNGAYRLAKNLGARALAARIAAALEELGVLPEERRNPEAPERAKAAGLTRRQLEIAGLIATGLSNKEIADKLFLSARTVEMHVANMLNRLDCRSRSEAVKKAVELGLLT